MIVYGNFTYLGIKHFNSKDGNKLTVASFLQETEVMNLFLNAESDVYDDVLVTPPMTNVEIGIIENQRGDKVFRNLYSFVPVDTKEKVKMS